ncbi:6-phosphogluconolactonase [Catenovulum adriaticum]|uniref:6-phosphogluconolactonase n=1 Tax=Catenovulum adriaticum TaxID=2984846 RepID=A0ABY7AI30_9ALTE|nr:6-phosphogluconolactonase [Catenovulum sp. TS8]WAJ69114.1 6-phosphogluconolactonase [Catenovulum sp. TS8]
MQFVEYSDTSDLNAQFAQRVAGLLANAIETKGQASLVVSGGRTPLPFFKALSNADIDWSKVAITLADERWVEQSSDASNTALVLQNLIQNKASKATFVELKTSEDSAFGAEASVSANLNSLSFPIDVLILGMGEDGHTASLFPCSEQIDQGLSSDKVCLAVQPTTAPHERMSLTLKSLLNSEQIFVHLVGESKKVVLDKALAGDDVKEMPIRAILKQDSTPVDVIWAAK